MDLRKDYGYNRKEIWWYFSWNYRFNTQHYRDTNLTKPRKIPGLVLFAST
jgi:hypothetical protein